MTVAASRVTAFVGVVQRDDFGRLGVGRVELEDPRVVLVGIFFVVERSGPPVRVEAEAGGIHAKAELAFGVGLGLELCIDDTQPVGRAIEVAGVDLFELLPDVDAIPIDARPRRSSCAARRRRRRGVDPAQHREPFPQVGLLACGHRGGAFFEAIPEPCPLPRRLE